MKNQDDCGDWMEQGRSMQKKTDDSFFFALILMLFLASLLLFN